MAEYVVDVTNAEVITGLSDISALWGLPMHERIVRCRDCKHAQVLHPLNPITGVPAGIEYWRCGHFWNADELCEVEPDGFCAWGERREDE